MSDLGHIETEELKSRITTIMNELDVVLREVGPKIKRIGQLREESVVIVEELRRRGIEKLGPGKDGG